MIFIMYSFLAERMENIRLASIADFLSKGTFILKTLEADLENPGITDFSFRSI
ncbi:hypothetical protein [Mesobacillus foraminis]|uniref:hypothetical protein n=1 Tax=Mesobacillus foraminis TaxID=279826 RepID=UPI0013CE68DF|nr:hypothetical protein [Mesobacillus foraminis]